MSRHGTYVGRKKIPPHDPYLLHGRQNYVWTIVANGADCVCVAAARWRRYQIWAECSCIRSQGRRLRRQQCSCKKSWGRKLRVPRISIKSVVPKRSSSKPKASSAVIKLVNAVCYGTLKDEKLVTFITGALELDEKDRQVRYTLSGGLFASHWRDILGRDPHYTYRSWLWRTGIDRHAGGEASSQIRILCYPCTLITTDFGVGLLR